MEKQSEERDELTAGAGGAPWEEAAVWGGAEHLLQGEQGGGGQGPGRSGSISLWG